MTTKAFNKNFTSFHIKFHEIHLSTVQGADDLSDLYGEIVKS